MTFFRYLSASFSFNFKLFHYLRYFSAIEETYDEETGDEETGDEEIDDDEIDDKARNSKRKRRDSSEPERRYPPNL